VIERPPFHGLLKSGRTTDLGILATRGNIHSLWGRQVRRFWTGGLDEAKRDGSVFRPVASSQEHIHTAFGGCFALCSVGGCGRHYIRMEYRL
jgi:hypothetical protein